MNLPSSNPPRFVCRCVRLARAISAGAFAGHVAGCADCQQAFAADDELDALLRRDAARLPQRDLGPLEDAIIGRIRAEAHANQRSTATSGRRLSPWAWLGAVCAAVAAVVVTFSFRSTAPQPEPHSVVARATPPEAIEPSAVVKAVSDRLFDSVAPAAEFLQQDPLQRELESIRADARSALSFLALNFLPTPREAAPAEPRTI